ncbi:TPA: MerR family transcriptional regulator [Legionella pneumophila]|uniref:MerR family transcriptional regulator n=1 Tax=Legionella pneumophila TaxID=446 RepID=UPI001A29F1EF|nr:MerR family transcriptional regulator [Legionella pneumophila]HAT8309853.1 MerR family transcriptional regulator [Legionella pneumophila]HAU0216925.1 MerR family transcriptional regulator [Legionella pneumophila]HAU1061853.1 MerR family transcriptional regulator [Legionella pneumophila]HAU1203817.1 MerR family transcriptional regulator [Legionella pneumophila]
MDKISPDKLSRILYEDSFLCDLGKYLEAKERGDETVTFLTEKKFTIKNIESTYRVINHWSKLGLFDDCRTDSKGWRKFSIVDMAWLRVLMELRTFGLSLEKIKKGYETIKNKLVMFEFGIASCMMKRGINLIIFKDGHIEITSRNTIALSESARYFNETSYIVISLNRCLELVFPNRNYTPELDTLELSKKEIFLLGELRLGKYDQLALQMKNGDIQFIDTTTKHFEIGKVADILNKISNGSIEIKKAKGKIIYLEETKKIKLEESML